MRDSVFYESQALLCGRLKTSTGKFNWVMKRSTKKDKHYFVNWVPKVTKNCQKYQRDIFPNGKPLSDPIFWVEHKKKMKIVPVFLVYTSQASLSLFSLPSRKFLDNLKLSKSLLQICHNYYRSTGAEYLAKCHGFWEVVASLHLSQVFSSHPHYMWTGNS